MKKWDEIYTRNAIDKYLHGQITNNIIDNIDEPPDFFIYLTGEKIALEVTQLHCYQTIGSKIVSDKSIISSNMDLLDPLRERFLTRLPSDNSIAIIISGFVTDKSKLLKIISDKINELLQTGDQNIEVKFNVDYANIRIQKSKQVKENRISMRVLPNKCPDIGFNLVNALTVALEKKVKKLQEFHLENPEVRIWLAFQNAYILADSDSVLEALQKVPVNECFSKLLFVDGETVSVIYGAE